MGQINIKWTIKRILIWLLGIVNKRKDIVLFESFGGKQYSDSPKAISETLHKMCPDIGIVWRLDLANERYINVVPDYVKKVSNNTYEYFKVLATAKCLITNGGIQPSLYKRKDQYIISTWHGDRGFKRIIYDSNRAKELNVRDASHKLTDLFITGSEYGTQRCRDSFLYEGEILCKGMPRNDDLVSLPQKKIKKIKDDLSIDEKCKILLFAPTYRDGKQKQKIEVDINTALSKLNTKGDKWICLIRCHPLSVGFDVVDNTSFVDVSGYPDMADLLLITDILITDYSSSSGDFILKNKPVILTHYDSEEYKKNHRALRFSPKEAGFFCVYNNDELVQLIENMTDDLAREECEKLKKFFVTNETGKSSEAVCQRIIEFIYGKK